MKAAALVLAISLSGACFAEQITLLDGSQLYGEVLSMNNGSYQVRTQSMGVIELKQSQVKSITAGSSPGSHSASMGNSMGAQAVQSLQARLANNEGIMSSVRLLQDDPDMQAVLSDPEVMRAIQNLDLKALANNPKIIKLMNNSHVQNIQGKVN